MTTSASHLDLLRARYRQLATSDEHLFLPVTFGVSDDASGTVGMIIEYRMPDFLETQEIDKKYAGAGAFAERDSAAEQLALCCVDVWTRDDKAGQPVKGVKGRWLPGLGLGEGPVGFARAAKLLELPAEDGLQAVCGVLRKDWQVFDHLQKLAAFEPEPPSQGVDDFLGESQAETDSAPTQSESLVG